MMARLSPPPPLCRATAPGGERVAVWHCTRHSEGAGSPASRVIRFVIPDACLSQAALAMRRRTEVRQRAGVRRDCHGCGSHAADFGRSDISHRCEVGSPRDAPPGASSAAAGASKVARFRAHGRTRDAQADACPPASKGLPAPARDWCRLSGRRRPVLCYVNRSGSCGGEAGVSCECDGPASNAAAGGRAMISETGPKPRGQ